MFLGPTTLSGLVSMQRRPRRLGGSLRVVAPGPRLYRILRITGLTTLLDLQAPPPGSAPPQTAGQHPHAAVRANG